MTDPAARLPATAQAGVWADGEAYELFVGRWSREVATRFIRWLEVPDGRRWLDAGCGTGALTAAVPHPALIVGLDPSLRFLQLPSVEAGSVARSISTDGVAGRSAGVAGQSGRVARDAARKAPVAGDAAALPFANEVFDAVVSGLALNFVPRPEAAVAEFARVAAPGAVVAAYVWDYADGMQMIRHFWDAATQVDPAAEALDEGPRFPICHAPALAGTWMAAGLRRVTTTKIEIPTVFRSFDDFWRPFLGGQGPAPAYLAAQPAERREAIRQALSARLGPDIIAMSAAAWAVRGYKQV